MMQSSTCIFCIFPLKEIERRPFEIPQNWMQKTALTFRWIRLYLHLHLHLLLLLLLIDLSLPLLLLVHLLLVLARLQ